MKRLILFVLLSVAALAQVHTEMTFEDTRIFSVKTYGAVGDAIAGTDGTATNGSTTFSSTGTACNTSRVGEIIEVAGAGAAAANLSTTVTGCSGNNWIMAVAASTTVSTTAKWVIGKDDSAALQAAWNAAKSTGGTILFPSTNIGSVSTSPQFSTGNAYLIKTALNWGAGLNVSVEGAGAIIFPDTNGVALDLTESWHLRISNLTLFEPQGLATPSTVGIFQGRGPNTGALFYNPYNQFTHNTIQLLSISTANGSNGTVALYNTGCAEQNTYYDNVLAADNAAVFTASNTYSISSPYYTNSNGVSCRQNVLVNNDMRSVGIGPALLLENIASMDILGNYFGGLGPYTNTSATYGIRLKATIFNTRITGMMEVFPQAILGAQQVQINRLSTDIQVTGQTSGSAAHMDLDGGCAGGAGCTGMNGSSIHLWGDSSQGSLLFKTLGANAFMADNYFDLDGFTGGIASVNFSSSSTANLLNNTSSLGYLESSCRGGTAGTDQLCGNSASHTLQSSLNGGSYFNVTQTIGTGNVTTAGTAVTNGTCQAQTGITVTGTATTDSVIANIGATLPATWQTGIVLSAHPTASNTVTVYLCNPTAASITPAATQVNVRVVR